MLCTKQTSIAILMAIAMLLCFSACQKDASIGTSIYVGNYYGITKEFLRPDPAGQTNTEYDIVYKIEESNNCLKLDGRSYPIEHANQTEFVSTNDGATLVFSNNFNSITYSYHRSYDYNYVYAYSKNFKGNRTAFPETTNQAPPGLEGNYILNIRKKSLHNGIDTTYVEPRTITKQSPLVSGKLFHSYWKYKNEDYPYNSITTRSISWTPSYFSYRMDGSDNSGVTHYSYKGPRQ